MQQTNDAKQQAVPTRLFAANHATLPVTEALAEHTTRSVEVFTARHKK